MSEKVDEERNERFWKLIQAGKVREANKLFFSPVKQVIEGKQ